MNDEFDTALIGGGIVGAAIGYGLARLGHSTAIFDGSDAELRASKTNFGLVWVQGKGDGYLPYQRLTRHSSDLWPAFAKEIQSLTGIDLEYRQTGGLSFCLTEAELEEERLLGLRMKNQSADYISEIYDRSRLEKMLPGLKLGVQVCGASFSESDGHVNPLLLHRALTHGFSLHNGTFLSGQSVMSVIPLDVGFRIITEKDEFRAKRIIIAAGLKTMNFADELSLPVRVEPQRGQLLITEKIAPVLPYAAIGIRQTISGSFQLGGTYENVGYSTDVTSSAAQSISARAIKTFPELGSLRVIRQWAGLRVLSPDGYPIYDQSRLHPDIHFVTCHSGVTLAAHHAGPFAKWLLTNDNADTYSAFRASRFEKEDGV